jgi:hypothetical protein
MQVNSLDRPIQTATQVLVEGRTGEMFFREFVEGIGLKEQVQVRDFGSAEKFRGYLKLFSSLKGFREKVASLGIIRDAESQPAVAAFQSVCAYLKEAGFAPPNAVGSLGEGTPRVGVYILPNCQHPGMLETLCWSVLEADPKFAEELACVTRFLDCLRANKVVVVNESKAKVWVYLSGRGRFDPLVGRAAQNKVWDWQSPALKPVADFLRNL